MGAAADELLVRRDGLPTVRKKLKPIQPRTDRPPTIDAAPSALGTALQDAALDADGGLGTNAAVGTLQGRPLPDVIGSIDIEPTRTPIATPRGTSATPKDARHAKTMTENSWDQKYRFFSAAHMRKSYTTRLRATKDPFNKDPSVGKSVLSRVATECATRNIELSALFDDLQLPRGNGSLNRAEIRRGLMNVVPELSDMEIAVVFNSIVEDGKNEVTVDAFREAVDHANDSGPAYPAATTRWRNPIYRVTRVPPASIEGWDHVADDLMRSPTLDKLCSEKFKEVHARLQPLLRTTFGSVQRSDLVSKYSKFNGGADSARFRRLDHQRKMMTKTQSSRLEDPGPELKPGWLCDPAGKQLLKGFGLNVEASPRFRA